MVIEFNFHECVYVYFIDFFTDLAKLLSAALNGGVSGAVVAIIRF